MARDPHDPGTGDLESMSPVTRRLLTANDDGDAAVTDPAYMHVVLCQTSMPYRRTANRVWEHENGSAMLRIEGGAVVDPSAGRWVDVPLPWGPKPRVVLSHLNAEALRQGDRRIEVESTLSAFGWRVLGYRPNGRQMRDMREHLTALATATVRMSFKLPGGGRYQTDDKIVRGMELWDSSDERQRTIWPAEIVFSEDYWRSLSQHAVPLNPRHIAALKHSAMALDIYTWLAQRLHRVPRENGVFVPWARLHEQFGHGYGRIDNFRRVFRRELRQVTAVYNDARVGDEIDERGTPLGLRLNNSKPPVLRRG